MSLAPASNHHKNCNQTTKLDCATAVLLKVAESNRKVSVRNITVAESKLRLLNKEYTSSQQVVIHEARFIKEFTNTLDMNKQDEGNQLSQ